MLLKPKLAGNTPYGAYELKRWYQPNMASATLLVGIAVGLIWFGGWLYHKLTYVDTDAIPTTVIESVMDLGPPPSIQQKPPQIEIQQPKLVQPKVGIPKPVADDEMVDEEVVLATKEELAQINTSNIDFGSSDGVQVNITEEILPSPDKFVKFEVQAKFVHKEKPVYPELARKAGLEGTVVVKVLVDKNGEVRDVIIAKESGANAGFEEAALTAARNSKFSPAIQNGRPIATWVAFPYEFKISN